MPALATRDPYSVLGVSKTASDAEVKKAFRTLAKKHHPDAHGNDPKAVKKFQEISAAYEIVGDKDKRGQYDRGEIDETGAPKGFAGGGQGFNPEEFSRGFRPGPFRQRGAAPGGGGFSWSSDEGGNPEDIFADLLGGLGGGGGRRRAQAPARGEDLQLATTISLDEAAHGGTRRVVLADGRQIEAKIPAGVKDGGQIRLRGQGGPGINGGPPGDAFITITFASHPTFNRDGRNLRLDLPITLKEALLGAKVQAPTLSGPVTLTVPPHSNSGSVLRLKSKGLPGSGADAAGDLYVKLVVTLPDAPDAKLDEFVKHWPGEYDPRAKLK